MVEVDGPEANDLADGDSGITERGAVKKKARGCADDAGDSGSGKRKRGGGGGGGGKRRREGDGWVHHGEWSWEEEEEFE